MGTAWSGPGPPGEAPLARVCAVTSSSNLSTCPVLHRCKHDGLEGTQAWATPTSSPHCPAIGRSTDTRGGGQAVALLEPTSPRVTACLPQVALAEAVKCGRSTSGGQAGLVGAVAAEEVPEPGFLQTRPTAAYPPGCAEPPSSPYPLSQQHGLGHCHQQSPPRKTAENKPVALLIKVSDG